MASKDPVRLTKSGKLRVCLDGTAPQEMVNAFVRYIDHLGNQLTIRKGIINLDSVAFAASLAMVLDIYEGQVVPQLRMGETPEEINLVMSRTEGLLMWQLAMIDPADVSEQMAWLKALNTIHQLLS